MPDYACNKCSDTRVQGDWGTPHGPCEACTKEGRAIARARREATRGTTTGCPRGEHVHRDGSRWPSGRSCGGDR